VPDGQWDGRELQRIEEHEDAGALVDDGEGHENEVWDVVVEPSDGWVMPQHRDGVDDQVDEEEDDEEAREAVVAVEVGPVGRPGVGEEDAVDLGEATDRRHHGAACRATAGGARGEAVLGALFSRGEAGDVQRVRIHALRFSDLSVVARTAE